MKIFSDIKILIFILLLASIDILIADFDDFDDVEPKNPILVDLNTSVLSLQGISTIYIDLRAFRGGNGDVSSGFLFGHELIYRHGYKGKIYFLLDEKSKKILERISGIKDNGIENGTAIYKPRTNLENLICYENKNGGIPDSVKPADMYVSLAKPSGNIVGSDERYISTKNPLNSKAWIPVKRNTYYVFQTVLGNTENRKAKHPYSTVNYKGINFLMRPAGLASEETGIYWDHVAVDLRGKNKTGIIGYLNNSLLGLSSQRDISVIRELVINRNQFLQSNPKMKIGLVYGVTHSDVKDQFISYLKGLSEHGGKKGEAYTIISPSKIELDDLYDIGLNGVVTLYEMDSNVDFSSIKNTPGHINIVLTKTLTHKVFTSLLAYSEIPPIIAGDAALSAAIIIGKPFVMTRIQWNANNIKNLVDLLDISLPGNLRENSFEDVWNNYISANLGKIVGKLAAYKNQFPELQNNITFLSDSILKAFNFANQLESESLEVGEIKNISNDTLRLYKLFQLAFNGVETQNNFLTMGALAQFEKESHGNLLDYIIKNPEESGKIFKNTLFFELLKGILAYEVKDKNGYLTSNRYYFEKIFPVLQGILGKDELLSIVKEILAGKDTTSLDAWQESYLRSLLRILSDIGSKEAIELVEKYFLPLKSRYINYHVMICLMLSEHSIFMKDTFKVLDNLINNHNVSDHMFNQFIVKKMEETGRSLSIHGWKVVELLKRQRLVSLIYKNDKLAGSGTSKPSLVEKNKKVLGIVQAASDFAAKFSPYKDKPCELLLH